MKIGALSAPVRWRPPGLPPMSTQGADILMPVSSFSGTVLRFWDDDEGHEPVPGGTFDLFAAEPWLDYHADEWYERDQENPRCSYAASRDEMENILDDILSDDVVPCPRRASHIDLSAPPLCTLDFL